MKKIYFLTFTLFCLGIRVNAQFTTLLNFNDTNGSRPYGSLTLSGSMLYGMTSGGGAHDSGCIFSVDTNGSGYKDLFDFGGLKGAFPIGSLIVSGNVLYGMTFRGGVNLYDGCVFSIQKDGNGYKKLLVFNDTNGSAPFGSLILLGGKLYGMTQNGGASLTYGCIFSIDTDGYGYKDLYDFNGVNSKFPYSSLTYTSGVLYGMAESGGSYSDGCIFSIDTNGNGYKNLLDFNGSNGSSPQGSLILSGSLLFGMTVIGGANDYGCIFSIDTNGGGYKKLLDFNGLNGSLPNGDLALSGNVLYGMTAGGGADTDGNIFSIDTNGSGYNDLFNFKGKNGVNPEGSLTLLGNIIYGMTNIGGTKNKGVIFSFKDTITSINELASTNRNIKVFPNPSNGIFTIQSSVNSGKSLIEVYNVLGEKVYEEPLRQAQGDNKIDVRNLSAGIYFYRVIAENCNMLSSGKLVIAL